MKKLNVFALVLMGLFTALVSIATMSITIPAPITGYIHLGDSMVYLSGILLGPVFGAVVSGLGSAIADGILGFNQYIPATLVVKFVDALVVGFIFKTLYKANGSSTNLIVAYVVAVLSGGCVMIGGYFAYEVFLTNFNTAVGGVTLNVVQAVGGAVLGLPLLVALEKGKVLQQFKTRLGQK